MSAILEVLAPYLAPVGAGLAFLIAAWFSGRSSAKARQQAEEMRAARRAREVEHEITQMDSPGLDAHIRKRGWVRK